MPTLAFKVQADYEKVMRLREEIHKLKEEMKGVDAISNPQQFNAINQKIKQCVDEYNNLTEVAAKAGAQIGVTSRKQIYDAQQAVNGFTEEIIKQKNIIADTSDKLKVLIDKYKDLKRNGQNIAANSMIPDINKAKNALDEEKFALFNLTQERAKAQLGVKKLREEYQLFAKESGASTDILAKMKSQIVGLGAGMLAGFGFKELGSEIIRVRGQFQQADTAIQTLLGSKDKADTLLAKVREYAKISPLEFGDITQATQMMLGFNIEAEKVPGFIKAIGDVSMGESSRFNSLTLAFSQMSATGKLMGQDLNQMINAGFNPLSVMAEKTGKSIAQLKDEMSKGAITAEMVQQAFIDATSQGGKFFNMSQNAAKTINGQLSIMHDAIDSALNDIGKESEGVIVDAISGVTKLIESYETVGRVLLGLATTYGTYRTALALVTFSQNGHTLAMTIARAQILLTQKAQALLNATILTNPYVLAATAIAGLVSALVLYKKSADEAELANEKLNKSFGATQAEITSEQKKIDELFDKLRKAEVGTNEYKGVKDAILNQYGSYLEGLNNEIATLKDVEGAYKAVAAAARDAALARGREAAITSANSDYNQKYSEYIGKIYDQLIKKGFNEDDTKRMLGWIQGDLKKTGKVAEDTQRALHKYGVEFSWFGELNKAERGLSYETQKINAMFGEQGKVAEDTSKKVSKLSDDYKVAERNFRNAKNWLKQIEENKSDYTTMEYKDALADFEAKKKAFKDVGGEPDKHGGGKSGFKADIAERVKALNDKQVISQLRAAKDLEFSTREAEIKAMQEGNEKTLKQLELNRDKELDAIERAYEDLRQKRIDEAKKLWDAEPSNNGKNFFNSDQFKYAASEDRYTDEERANRVAKRKAADAEYLRSVEDMQKAELRSLYDYLEEYGSFQEKKLAITQKYEQKIKDARTTGEKMRLERQMDNALEGIDNEELKKSFDWETIFNDLDKVSVKHLERLKERLKRMLSSNDISAENAMIISKRIGAINEQITKKQKEWRSVFGLVIPELERIKQKRKEELDANNRLLMLQQKHVELLHEEEKIKKEIAGIAEKEGISLNTNDISLSNQNNIFSMFQNLGKDTTKLSDAFSKLGKNQAQATQTTQALAGAEGEMAGAMAGAGGSAAEVVAWIDTIVHGINDNVQSAKDLVNQMGYAETKFGKQMNNFAEGSQYATDAWEALKSGNVMGVVNGVYGSLRILGENMGLLGISGFGQSDVDLQDDIERLTQSNEDLRLAVDNLAEKMEKSAVVEATDIYYKQRDDILQEMANTLEMMQRSADASNNGFLGIGGSHSSGHKINEGMSNADWDRISKIVDKEVRSAGDFFDLTSEEMYKVFIEATDLYSKIKDLANDGYADAAQFMDTYIMYWKELEELENAYLEKLTSTSFDSVLSDFTNLIMDMDSDVEDFTDSFEEKMQSAIANAITSERYRPLLEKWYKAFGNYIKDGVIDELEMKKLKEEGGTFYDEISGVTETFEGWTQIAQEAYNEMKAMKDMFGWEDSTKKDQTATMSMADKVTYDQFDTYLGIATAQQIAQEQIKDRLDSMTGDGFTLMNMNLEQIVVLSTLQRDIADESRDILAKSYLELQEANEHLGKIEKSVDRIEASVSNTEHLINDRL